MKEKNLFKRKLPFGPLSLTIVIILVIASGVFAQTVPSGDSAGSAEPRPAVSPDIKPAEDLKPNPEWESEAVQKRIRRARALAAAHYLETAASELESIRKGSPDEVIKNVTSVMLMEIYLEVGSYARAEALLEETYQQRSSRNDASLRTYFALAGQAVNGVRSHLARYRGFGLNVSSEDFPSEALTDLERLRSLLERMIAQGKEISRERKAYDALALLEDILGLRLFLARNGDDKAKWTTEYAAAREGLASTHTQVAALGALPRGVLKPPSASPVIEAPLSKASTSDSLSPKTAPASSEQPKNAEGVLAKGDAKVDQSSPRKASESSKAVQPSTGKEGAAVLESSTRLSTGVLNSRASKKVVPVYPPEAKAAGESGLVKVYVKIDEGGKVTEVLSSEGPATLRASAEEAARKWRFQPTAVNGRAVQLFGYIEFEFKP